MKGDDEAEEEATEDETPKAKRAKIAPIPTAKVIRSSNLLSLTQRLLCNKVKNFIF